MLRFAEGRSDDALTALRSAASAFRRDRQPYEVATLTWMARTHARVGDDLLAEQLRTEARDILDRLGAQTGTELPVAIGVGPLTAREAEVLSVRRRRRQQPRRGRTPVHQREDGRAAPREHLRQARRRFPHGRSRVVAREQRRGPDYIVRCTCDQREYIIQSKRTGQARTYGRVGVARHPAFRGRERGPTPMSTIAPSPTAPTHGASSAGHQTADEFAERIVQSMLGWAETLAFHLGDRLGWYASLAEHGPSTADELAARTATSPRYAQEWLEQRAVTGTCRRRSSEPALHPAAGAAEALTDERNLAYAAPLGRMAAGAGAQIAALLEAYRTGGGVSWKQFGADVRGAGRHEPALVRAVARDIRDAHG